MRFDRVHKGPHGRRGVADAVARESAKPLDAKAGERATMLLVALRIDNLETIRSGYGDAAAEAVLAELRTALRVKLAGAPGITGGVVTRGDDMLDIVARGTDGTARARIQGWIAALARLTFYGRGWKVHAALSWVCAEADLDADDRALSSLLAEARARLPQAVLAVPVGTREFAQRDMAAATALYAELNAGELQFAWEPVVGLDADAVLCLRASVAVPGSSGAIQDRVDAYRAAERLGLVQAFDRALVIEAVEHLARSDGQSVCVTVSAASFRASGWWDAVLERLEREPALAQRLFIALDCVQSFPVAGPATEFADRLRRLGCRIVLQGLGAGQIAIATLLALRPDVVTLDPFLVRLALCREPDQQLFRHIVGLAAAIAPAVVVEGIDSAPQLLLAAEAGVQWACGPRIAPLSWRGPARIGRPAAQVSAFVAFAAKGGAA